LLLRVKIKRYPHIVSALSYPKKHFTLIISIKAVSAIHGILFTTNH